MGRLFIILGALGGFAGVAAGASARHLAGGDAASEDLLDIAARYLLIHAVALVALASLMERAAGGHAVARAAGVFFLLGMALFGGGLILAALTHEAFFDFLVPVGGTSFLIGWLAFALYGARRGLDTVG